MLILNSILFFDAKARFLVFLIFYQTCGWYLVDLGQEVAVRKCGQVVVGQVVVEQVEAAGQWPLPGSPQPLLATEPGLTYATAAAADQHKSR